MDYKTSKWYRWSSLQFAINNGLKKNYEHLLGRNFVHVQPVDSKKDDIIQLVDILLGSLAKTQATALHKIQLSQYVYSKLNNLTKSQKQKFIVYENWTPKPRDKTTK